MSSPTTGGSVVIVPHTHWDREWYEPHDVFRLRLVHMLDGLLNLLEAYPQYRFTLDGQAVAVDDYLEMRPGAKERVRRAVRAGQLAVGPFLILLDEFCCDGETIIRNLELGIKSSRDLGGEMRVGYLPDMFGHAAQTPQILAGFGIGDASLWRGVPAAIEQHAFTWEALDGSGVRCQYLFDGYGNGLDLFALEGQLGALAEQYVQRTRDWYRGDEVLAMLGSDHTAPLPDLVERLEACANGDASEGMPALRLDTIEGYIRAQTSGRSLPTVRGELRSHARGNLLPGVFSIRTNLKRAMADAERAATIAERMDALFPGRDHQRFLDSAWYRIVESTAHDSVTGCGVDATAEQVETRLHTAEHTARAVTEAALAQAAMGVDAGDYLVVNPSAYARPGHVELTVGGASRAPEHAQVICELPTVLGDEQLRGADLVKLLRRIHGRELFGQQINGYAWGDGRLRFDVAEVPVGDFDLAAFTGELEQRVAAGAPDARWHVLTVAAPRQRVLLEVPLSGLGVGLASGAVPPRDPVSADRRGLRNAALRVGVNPDGTVDIEAEGYAVGGALRLVDEGDRGDSYNYGPVTGTAPLDQPTSVRVTVLEEGPVRARVRVDRTYRVPTGLDPQNPDRRLASTTEMTVATVLELRSGEEFLRVTVSLTNPVADHRLRLLVPAGARGLGTSAGAGQYGVTERQRSGEGGWGEFPLPTYPATQFVAAGKTTVLLDKLTEYELISDEEGDGPDSLAVTLVRAVGMMSVNIHPLRDEPAGSEIPVPGAQYLGEEVVTRLAVLPSPGGWEAAEAARQADVFRFGALVARGGAPAGNGSVLPVPAVEVETTGAVPLASLRLRRDDVGRMLDYEARFVNYGQGPARLGCRTSHDWARTDLAGEARDSEGLSAGSSAPELGPSVIATFRSRID